MAGKGQVRVSTNGASSPRWRRDGRELFFYDGDGRIMAVPVISDGAELTVGAATVLFETSLLGGLAPGIPLTHQFDVTSDGRFLLNVPVEPVNDRVVHRGRQLDIGPVKVTVTNVSALRSSSNAKLVSNPRGRR